MSKRFGGQAALCGVDLEVAPHECQALRGPSGCGKTMLLRLLAGLEKAEGGRRGAADLSLAPGAVAWIAVSRGQALLFDAENGRRLT